MKSGVSISYAYDRFGNRWQQNGSGGPTPQYVIDTNHHINGSGVSYDVLGNVTNDGAGHIYSWDAENRLSNVNSGTTYLYDAFGRRVRDGYGEVLYDLAGHAVTWLDASTGGWNLGEIYAGGRHVVSYSNGTTNFLHTDWLGSKRVMTSVAGMNSETCTTLPFGDGGSCTGSNWNYDSFTDDTHDPESNSEHTLFRQLTTTQGRWLTPDPSGLAAVDPTNPQTWNGYAYVINNPLSYVDPFGLSCDDPHDGKPCVVTVDGGSSGGTVEAGQCYTVLIDNLYAGSVCGAHGRGTDPGDRGGRDPGGNGGVAGDGGGDKISAAVAPGLAVRKPTVCSAGDLVFRSLDFSVKFGLEANVGNVLKLGGSFFKNLTTGQTGASAGVKVGIGYEIGTQNPPNVPLTAPAGQVTHTGSIGPFQRNFTTGENSVNLSLGFVLGVGGEISFNPKKFYDLAQQCDHIID